MISGNDTAPEIHETVVEQDVMVPAPDGTHLATDLRHPAEAGRPLPGPLPALAGVEIDGVYRSQDGGDTWAHVDAGITNPDIHGMAFSLGEQKTLLVSTPREIFASQDECETFQSLAAALGRNSPVPEPFRLPVATEAEFDEAYQSLQDHGVDATEIIERGYGKTFYFHDPNGIRLQIELQTSESTDDLTGDSDPVPMVRELSGLS